MTDNITPNQKKLLNDHAKEIKVGNFQELIYDGWKYTTRTIVGVLHLFREAGIYPFNQEVLQSYITFSGWIGMVVDLGQMNDYTKDLAIIPVNDPDTKSKLTIAKALGTSCYKVANPKSPHRGMLIVTNKYSDIEMLLESHSGWFPGLEMKDLTKEF